MFREVVMSTRTWLTQLIGISFLSSLVIIVVPFYTQIFPDKMANHVQGILHENALTWAKVSAEGRNITLKGNTTDLAQHQKALQLSRSLWFVKQINDEITPTLVEPYTMKIRWDGSNLAIEGYMSSDTRKDNLQQYIAQQFTGKKNKHTLQTGLGSPEGWDELMRMLVEQIKNLQLASVHIIDQQVDISGKSLTSREIYVLEKAMTPFREQDYSINIRIAALDNAAIVCQKEFNRLLTTETILFKTGNAVIDSNSDQLLVELANTAIFCANATIIIAGYTDDVGDDEKNIQLSEQRAKAVKGRLFNQGGVPLERLKTVGKGSAKPLASNETETGRAKNRRIEFKVEGI